MNLDVFRLINIYVFGPIWLHGQHYLQINCLEPILETPKRQKGVMLPTKNFRKV